MKKIAPIPEIDPFVFTKKTPFMQRISDLVRTGHTQYAQGVLPVGKVAGLSEKFNERFKTERGKLENSRARKRGEGTARLLFWYHEEPEVVHFVLLYCSGEKADASEKWRDALKDRVQLTGYELVRLTKPQEPQPTWTWRYTRTRHDELREAVVQAIRQKRDDELRKLIHSLWRTPGFAGARDQVKKFKDLIKGEWKRTRGDDQMPEIPDRLGYVRRLKDVGQKLSKLNPLLPDELRTSIKKSLGELLKKEK